MTINPDDHAATTTRRPAPPALAPLPPPAGPVFEVGYRMRTGDVDQTCRLRLDGVARYLQDIANDMIEQSDFRELDPFWIVRRTIIDVVSPMSWPGNVTLRRWCSATSTRWSDMRVSLHSEHETSPINPVMRPPGRIEAVGFWINVTDKGVPSRISDEGFASLSSTAGDLRLRWRTYNTAPDPGPSASDREHRLRATDFDAYRHVNNAASWEAVEDELVEHPDLVATPHRAVIEYLRPIVPGDVVTIRRRRDADALQLWFVVAGEVATTVSVAPLPPGLYDDERPIP